MRVFVSRLSASLRGRFTPTCLGYLVSFRIPRLPVISASAAAGGFLLTTDSSSKTNVDSWRQSFFQDARPASLANVSSLRDVPLLVSEAFSSASGSVKKRVLKQIDTEGGAAIITLTAANLGVYLLWKTAPTTFMVRHFANSLESLRRGRVWTSVTSNFSHMGIFHLAANMYLLNRFGPDVADVLGSERFYLFYGTAGVASSLASLTFRRLTKSNVLSLGASGAVVSVLWLNACFFPDRRMAIWGTERTLTMQELVLAYTVMDAAGLLGSLGKIDFAAHLGGAFFGNFWFYLVRDKLVREEAARHKAESHTLFRSILRTEGRPSKRE